ncbi:MAG TPA: Mur ligase domain-containing protein, partial [Opitutaceae bacterium]|nr:Mur ligase domain-containing protein [Opitutaceae bacterium]
MIAYLTQNHALIHAFRPAPQGLTRGGRPLRHRIFKMAPKLQDYFPPDTVLAVKGELDRPISGLTMDSRRVVPGNLFFALPGLRTDGAAFIDEAINRGAVGIVTQKPHPLPHGRVTFIQVADARATLARVAQRYYKFPDQALRVIGVTGTNGKTTVTHLLKHFLENGERVGL